MYQSPGGMGTRESQTGNQPMEDASADQHTRNIYASMTTSTSESVRNFSKILANQPNQPNERLREVFFTILQGQY